MRGPLWTEGVPPSRRAEGAHAAEQAKATASKRSRHRQRSASREQRRQQTSLCSLVCRPASSWYFGMPNAGTQRPLGGESRTAHPRFLRHCCTGQRPARRVTYFWDATLGACAAGRLGQYFWGSHRKIARSWPPFLGSKIKGHPKKGRDRAVPPTKFPTAQAPSAVVPARRWRARRPPSKGPYSAITTTCTGCTTSAWSWMSTSYSPTERITPSGSRTSARLTVTPRSSSARAISTVPTEP